MRMFQGRGGARAAGSGVGGQDKCNNLVAQSGQDVSCWLHSVEEEANAMWMQRCHVQAHVSSDHVLAARSGIHVMTYTNE